MNIQVWKKIILTIVIAFSVLSINSSKLMAEDMVAGAVIKGSACLFGTMVGATALLSLDRRAEQDRNNRNTIVRNGFLDTRITDTSVSNPRVNNET